MFRDFLNRELRVGDTIVYPGRHGSSLWMNAATILELVEATDSKPACIKARIQAATGWRRTFAGRQTLVTLRALDNVVVVARQGEWDGLSK